MRLIPVIVGFQPPENETDSGRRRVIVFRKDYDHNGEHVGWVDKQGFHLHPSLQKPIALSAGELSIIENEVEFLNLKGAGQLP